MFLFNVSPPAEPRAWALPLLVTPSCPGMQQTPVPDETAQLHTGKRWPDAPPPAPAELSHECGCGSAWGSTSLRPSGKTGPGAQRGAPSPEFRAHGEEANTRACEVPGLQAARGGTPAPETAPVQKCLDSLAATLDGKFLDAGVQQRGFREVHMVKFLPLM